MDEFRFLGSVIRSIVIDYGRRRGINGSYNIKQKFLKMEKKRNIFLMGAGAVIDWGAPNTCDLTKIVLESGFSIKDSEIKITKFIYDKLKDCNKYSNKDINFETIINVIEELIVYYSYFNAEKKLPSLVSSFFKPCFEEELLNFQIDGEIQDSYTYKLIIPGENSDFAPVANNDIAPNQFFFQQLLFSILTRLRLSIDNLYALHTRTNPKVLTNQKNQEANALFIDWMKSIANEGILRMYTLNYDRNFKILLEHENIQIFEGFSCGECVPSEVTHLTTENIKKILSDFDCHVHYNLHGSIFWEVEPLDQQGLPNPEIVLSRPYHSSYRDQAMTQIEKGKMLMVTNIITGYQKAQKAMITPFKQMQSSFDKDCFLADEIYVIGYSFGDEHINTSIKTALKYNDKLIVHIVDLAYDESDNKKGYELLADQFIKIFIEVYDSGSDPIKINEKCYSYFKGKIIVNALEFKEFLKLQL